MDAELRRAHSPCDRQEPRRHRGPAAVTVHRPGSVPRSLPVRLCDVQLSASMPGLPALRSASHLLLGKKLPVVTGRASRAAARADSAAGPAWHETLEGQQSA